MVLCLSTCYEGSIVIMGFGFFALNNHFECVVSVGSSIINITYIIGVYWYWVTYLVCLVCLL